MKKGVFTLVLCLAFTITPALAKSNSILMPQSNSIMPSTGIMPGLGGGQFGAGQLGGQQAMTDKRSAEDKKAQQRQLKYEALGLDQEQKGKAELQDYKTKKDLAKTLKKYKKDAKKLHELKVQHASKFAIWRQERLLNKSKRSIEKTLAESKKNFRSLLNSEQKKKLDAIESQQQAKLDKLKQDEDKKQAKIKNKLQKPPITTQAKDDSIEEPKIQQNFSKQPLLFDKTKE